MTTHLRINLQYSPLISKIFCRKVSGNSFYISGSGSWELLNIGKKFYSQGANKNIVSSPLGEISIPEKPFHEVVLENSSVWEWKTAIKCGRSGRKYTFRQLKKLSKTMAAGFQNRFKLSKGDILALFLPNVPEYPLIFLAASQSGLIVTTINPVYSVYEVQRHLTKSNAKVIVTSTNLYDKCAESVAALKISSPIFVIKLLKSDEIPQGAIDFFELYDESTSGSLTPVDFKQSDILALPFSSGTTGIPKGVILSHKNLVSNLTQLSHPDTAILMTPTWFRQSTVLGILPMCHIFGLMIMTFFTIKEGGYLMSLPSFEPREFVKVMYTKKMSIIYAVPQLISFLTHKAILPRYLKHVKYIVNGAGRFSTKDAQEIFAKAETLKIVQGYGMTESSPVLAHTYSKRIEKLTTVGIPIASTKLKVTSLETGETLPVRKIGELRAFGPQVMRGYFEAPEETKNAFDEEGWLKTGDMAYYDEDGDFYIVDRLKDLIKVSGFQVSPAELEESLRVHPKIKDAVVVGVPHEKFGEVPKAFVILHKKGDMTGEEVAKFISDRHSAYKGLKGGVVFVDEFPKNNTGKILRIELRKMSNDKKE